jgi:two-component system sensor histidine kinase PilS (NtrC family)
MLAALLVWQGEYTDSGVARLATVVFALTTAFTLASWLFSESLRVPPRPWFLFLQILIDLGLVTFIVDVTGAGESPLAAFFVVVVAVAFLLLPTGGGAAATALAAVLYVVDVYLHAQSPSALVPATLFVLVLVLTAAVSRATGLRLKEAGAGSAELAAQLQHIKLQAADILRNIRSGIITVDATGRLIQANPAAANILGIDFTPFEARPVLSKLSEVSPDLTEMLVRTIKRPTRINRGEALMPRNGRSVPLGVTTTFAEAEHGAPATATAIFQDITESKRMEHLSLRAERLAAVAELSASLAHEIKNPLASIRSAVEQLSRVRHATEDERILASLVERESDRLARLLTEFLDFARVHAANFRTLDIVELARGSCALAGANPDIQPGVTVECVAEPPEMEIEGDEDLLHRAVFNLVLNAAQASPAGGLVSVRLRKLQSLQLESLRDVTGDAVELTVTDQGPGISPEARARIFDPFFTTKTSGTGLGLSVVHRAITSHRGVVLVDAGDTGTKFTVVLPMHQGAGGDTA